MGCDASARACEGHAAAAFSLTFSHHAFCQSHSVLLDSSIRKLCSASKVAVMCVLVVSSM